MRKTTQIFIIFIIFFLLFGCATSQLKKIKAQHKSENYETVVKTKVDCNKKDDVCNQMHLIKGDACYRLAKKGTNPTLNYDCAIKELDSGILLTKNWKVGDLDLNRNQTYENLSESIRARQDMSKGDKATGFTTKLLKVSKRLLAESPDNIIGIYYQSSAKFTSLGRAILMTPEDKQVCKSVNQIITRLQSMKDKVVGGKYAAMYSQLMSDVSGIKPVLINCQ